MSVLKRAAIAAGAVVVTSLVSATPVHAGTSPTTGPSTATLTITKVVEGTAPADAAFTIQVNCEGSGMHELTYGADGGDQSVVFTEADQCDITEPDNGGASSTTGLGHVDILSPILYARTVVNTFDPVASSSSSTVDTAAEVATRPTFTG